MRRPHLALCLLLACAPARAEIYKFIDDEGNVTYTNMPRPGAKKLDLGPLPGPTPPSPPKGSTPAAKPRVSTPSPAYFPKVDAGTQRRRDDMRRQLLMQELASEQRNLDAARRALAEAGRQPGADLNRLAEAVRLHEKNIEMLNKELALIR
ncbi:MAG: DUF4124 domain-containing protein [Thiobacillaceae bacterium]|nr:DUF4124 domain-containing protein [Thiobacillaceae bacterium]MCX7673034.1 DUF4124 domain-containing protein [Thiobacillaceae bacterium]MDW8323716.1 DUF4124 domain-containing protein [Burkholderiales bacterium]